MIYIRNHKCANSKIYHSKICAKLKENRITAFSLFVYHLQSITFGLLAWHEIK